MATLNWKGPQATRIILDAAEKGVQAAALVVIEVTGDNIGKMGTGRIYKRPSRPKPFHRASEPGQFPALDTGNLKRSLAFVIEREGFIAVSAIIGTDQPYGRHLEFGTRNIARRPWLRRSAEESRARWLEAFDAQLRVGMGRLRGLFPR